jgi:hypothetical protein
MQSDWEVDPFAALKVPAGQSEHVLCPDWEYLPGEHCLQVFDPSSVAKYPSGQGSHWLDSLKMDLNLPGGHLVQMAWPSSEDVPAPHGTHADAAVDLVLGFAVPAAQAVHGDRPVEDQDPVRQTEMQSDRDVDWGWEEYSFGHSRQLLTFAELVFGL